MKPYAALMTARFRVLLQYRAAAAAGFTTQLFFGFIMVMAFGAFYRSTSAPQPISYAQVVTYVWLGQALFAMLPNIDAEVRDTIRNGYVVYELLRPVDLYGAWFSRTLALRMAPTLLRAIPMAVVAGLFLGLSRPASMASGSMFVLALAGALLLGCAISTLANITLLWTIGGEGIVSILPVLVWFLSGMNIPLPLLPRAVERTLWVLPFRGLVDTPLRIYSGNIGPAMAWGAVAHQLVWTVALVLAGRALLQRALRRLEIQGG